MMKYYVYLSDSKLEMLFGQLEHAVESKSDATVGFDLKVLKGELKRSREIADNRYTQLNTVLDQLNTLDAVGGLHSDKPYLRGTLLMQWASFGWSNDSPVTMWGYVDEFVALGLAGSRYHIVGEKRPDGGAHSHSGTEAMQAYLSQLLLPKQASTEVGSYSAARHAPSDAEHFGLYNLTWLAVSQMSGEKRRFEFVAKVLGRSEREPGQPPSWRTNVILASPLYVALVE